MNYKILIFVAIITIVLLSGCLSNDQSRPLIYNRSANLAEDSNVISANEHKINTGHGGNERLYIFHIREDNRAYTCFYMEGGGAQVNKALSCSLDYQTVV